MSFLESIQNRYTTKKYNPSKKIDPSKIDELKNILRLSPSSINSQPWRFTYISDNDKRKQLSEISVSAKRSWQLLLTIAVLAFVCAWHACYISIKIGINLKSESLLWAGVIP